MQARLEAAAREQVGRERLHGEGEIHDLDRMTVAAGDVRLPPLGEHVGMAAAGQRVRGHAGPHLLAGSEGVDRDLALVVAAVRDHDPILEVDQRLRRDAVDRPRGGDEHVRVRKRLRERRDPMPVHVRLERRDGIDLDHGHAPARAACGPRETLADPAVADDAELPSGEGEVRQPVDRGERRLSGPVAVVEQVLAERVIGRDCREREPAVRLHRAQARDPGRRLLGDAGEAGGDVGTVLDDPRRQLRAVVDDDLRPGPRDREQVGLERLA